MKISAIIRIVLFSLAILILSFILLSVLFQNYYLEDMTVHSYEDAITVEPILENNHAEISSSIRNLKIEWVAGSVTILPDENTQSIIITEYSSAESAHQMIMDQAGQTLKIQFSKESMIFPSFGIDVDVSKDLLIKVPADWICNELDIDAAATQVSVHEIQIGKLNFDGASGNLILDHCDIGVLDIDTASGDVEFSGKLDELEFDAASAKFHGEFLKEPRKLNLDAMSGDLTVVLPEDSGFYLEVDTVSGSFDSDFDFTVKGDHYEHGDGNCKIMISAVSGDISILKGIPAPAENCDH